MLVTNKDCCPALSFYVQNIRGATPESFPAFFTFIKFSASVSDWIYEILRTDEDFPTVLVFRVSPQCEFSRGLAGLWGT